MEGNDILREIDLQNGKKVFGGALKGVLAVLIISTPIASITDNEIAVFFMFFSFIALVPVGFLAILFHHKG